MKKTIYIIAFLLNFVFNINAQIAPSSGITGTLTTGTIPKAIGLKKVGNSSITDKGSQVTVNNNFYVNSGGAEVAAQGNIAFISADQQTTSNIESNLTENVLFHSVKNRFNAPINEFDGVVTYSTDVQALSSRNNLKMYTIYGTSGDATTTSTVPSSASDYSFTPTANKRYRISGILHVGCNNTGGIKIQLTLPTGATCWIDCFGQGLGPTAFIKNPIVTSATLTSAFCLTNTTNGEITMNGEISVGATVGTIQLGFASTTGGQTSTIYQLGSYITITQIN